MLWSISQPRMGVVVVDVIYLVGLICLFVDWRSEVGNRLNSRLVLHAGWFLVLTAFLMRFTSVLSLESLDHPDFKPIALARVVLHTLIAPMVNSLALCCRHLVLRCRATGWRRWHIWICVVGVGMVMWLAYSHVNYLFQKFGKYPKQSDFP
jgi:hypothetical protein